MTNFDLGILISRYMYSTVQFGWIFVQNYKKIISFTSTSSLSELDNTGSIALTNQQI